MVISERSSEMRRRVVWQRFIQNLASVFRAERVSYKICYLWLCKRSVAVSSLVSCIYTLWTSDTHQFPNLFRWRKPCLKLTYPEEDEEEEVSSCGMTIRHGSFKVFIAKVHIRYCGRVRGPHVGKLQ